ncbi:MAG TPA: hypothetical protein VF604_03665 [Pyrinomonadaceae bacterium]|jgi:hypothetical protein
MQNQSSLQILFRRLLSSILLAAVFASAFPAAMAQVKRGVTSKTQKTATTTPAKKSPLEAEEKIDLNGVVPPDSAKTMSAAFENGKLPAALALPAGEVEAQAVVLADMVKAGDANSTAALITALKAAGYGIRNAEGDVAFENVWQGIALEEWEVAALAKLYGSGYGIGLGRLGDSLALIEPEWKKETNARDIVLAIRRAATSDNQSVRFWGNFIVELGRRGKVPFDLRNDEEVKYARLDAVQVAMILSRLSADTSVAARRMRQQQAIERNATPQQPNGGVRLLNASYSSDFQARNAIFRQASFQRQQTLPAFENQINSVDEEKLPCALSEAESVILDYNATVTTTLFGEFMNYLERKGTVTDKPGKAMDKANAVLTVMKLIATYAALTSEITLEGGMLTRTKTTTNGERKALTAKVKIDVGKWQVMNCIRMAINVAGLDFSLPGNGLLANSRVDWSLVEGGVANSELGRMWYTVKNIPKVVMDGTMDNGDAIVFLDTQAGVKADDKNPYNYTDENGESKIYAVGMRQKKDLSKVKLRPVMKQMAVDIEIQVKTMKIKNGTAAAGTFGDLAGNAVAFLTDDMLGAAVGTAAETLYRAPAGWSKTYAFPVKDWIECDGGWSGRVTYRHVKVNDSGMTIKYDGPTQSNQPPDKRHYHQHVWRDLVQHDGIIDIKTELNAGGKPELKATAGIISQEARYTYGIRTKSTNCKGTKSFEIAYHEIETTNGTAYGTGEAESFNLSVYNNVARLSFMFPKAVGNWQQGSVSWWEGACDFKTENKPPTKWIHTIDRIGDTIDNIPVDPQNPYVLKGSRNIPGSKPGEGVLVTWDLERCL